MLPCNINIVAEPQACEKRENGQNLKINHVFLGKHGSCPCCWSIRTNGSCRPCQGRNGRKMSKLLTWINDLMERWTQREYDHYFKNPESIKDIDKFLRDHPCCRL